MPCSEQIKFKRLGSSVQGLSFATPVKHYMFLTEFWLNWGLTQGRFSTFFQARSWLFPGLPVHPECPWLPLLCPFSPWGIGIAAGSSLSAVVPLVQQGGCKKWDLQDEKNHKILGYKNGNRGNNLGQNWRKLWLLQLGIRDLWAWRLKMGSKHIRESCITFFFLLLRKE